jgi:hypothetical protein
VLDDLNTIIGKKRALFQDHKEEMVAAYKRELETNEGYNGRQLLELIQNCDDEGAKKVLISLDKDKNELKISNTGNPFSLKGYRSIVTSNLSAKSDKKKYIGNKGLGFRSIINWADEISIHSNDLLLTFSQQAVKEEYKKMFPGRTGLDFNKEYGVKQYEIPIPLLSIPKIEKVNNNSEYSTSIIIKYKESFLTDIEKQVTQLRSEVLLFLHHIQEIQFEGFDSRKDIKCVKEPLKQENEFGPSEIVHINDKVWHIFKREGELEGSKSEEEDTSNFFQLKLAVSENMENDYKYLFSFFPTRVRMKVPYLIHGTFDLDQNRNQLNSTNRNRKVLNKLVGFIVETAKFYTEKEVSWKPLSLLNFKDKDDNPTLEDLGFNKAVDKALKEEKLWPCVSNTYKSRNECIYVDDDFAQFLLDNEIKSRFGNLIIPRGNFYIHEFFKRSNISNIEDAIDDISETVSDLKVRTELVYHANRCFGDKKFSLLTNTDGDIIDKNDEIFTPATKDVRIPSFCRIHFINTELFNLLVKRLRLEDAKSKPRSIVSKLSNNCSIISYEPQNLIQKIISGAKRELNSKDRIKSKKAIVTEMVQSMFAMYQSMSGPSDIRTERIPLLNADGNIKESRELYLCNSFETGRKALSLFKKIRNNDVLLSHPSEYGLENKPVEELEQFFNWLGVNKFVQYVEIRDKEALNAEEMNYMRYALQQKGHEYTSLTSVSYTYISDLKAITEELSIEEIISWIHIDSSASSIISEDNDLRKIRYSYYSGKVAYYVSSYLQYRLAKAGYNFNSHLVESKYSWVNKIKIDFNHAIFKQLNIDSYDVASILKSLGGKASFNDLSINRVKQIINLLPEKFPDGKNSQTIYKAAVDHYKYNDERLGAGYKLFAKTKDDLKLFDPGSIYFSDKAKLPSKLMDDFPILNFPSRGGGQSAIEFFGINDLADIEISIDTHSVNKLLNSSLQQYFQSLKPYILLYRLDKVQSDSAREQFIRSIKNVNIIICTDLTYSANDSKYIADLYEYVPGDENTFYIKCNREDTLHILQENSTFSDSFANILSELFNVSDEKSEYRALFRGGIDDAKYVSEQNFGEDLIRESKLLLGVGDNYRAFWEVIYQILSKEYKAGKNPPKELGFNTDLRDLDYDELNAEKTKTIIINLFKELEISISAFNSKASRKLSLEKYHQRKFESILYNYSKRFRALIWGNLNNAKRDQKKKLLEVWALFEDKSVVRSVGEENEEKIEVDYHQYLQRILKKFDLTLQELDEIEQDISAPDAMFESNRISFNNEQLNEIESDLALKSLLYFENEVDYLLELLEPDVDEIEEDSEDGHAKGNKEKKKSANLIRDNRLVSRTLKNRNGSRKPFAPSLNENERKIIGDKCQDIVYDKLVQEYVSDYVDKVTNRDEGLHYDIRYSPDEGKNWIFVEVKNMAKGSFILTRDEKIFGQENAENYELHLVDLSSNEIYVIENPYNSDEIDVVVKDYVVYYELIEKA